MPDTNPATELLPDADDFTLIVQPCDNGFIVRCGPRVEVVEEAEMGDASEARASLALLYTVLDMLGRVGSKHDAYRCRVRIFNSEGEDVTDTLPL